MTTLALTNLLADLSLAPAQALQSRLKWTVDAEGNWCRVVNARDGNTEHFIRRVPELDLDVSTLAQPQGKDVK